MPLPGFTNVSMNFNTCRHLRGGGLTFNNNVS